MPALSSNVAGGADDENRLAVSILILDELERRTGGRQRLDRARPVEQHQRVEEYRRGGLHRHLHLDLLAVSAPSTAPSLIPT